MNPHFLHIPPDLLDPAPITEYFKEHFENAEVFGTERVKLVYEIVEPEFLSFSNYLVDTFDLPPLAYYAMFRHDSDQPIHMDGLSLKTLRMCSLNLPVSGFENSMMRFYEHPETITYIKNAIYFNVDQTSTEIDSTECRNEWLLANTKVPHNVTITPGQVRYTICFRFHGNPTFAYVADKFMKVMNK